MFDLEKIKKFYLICVKIYCKRGQIGVCEFAENIVEICEEKFAITVGQLPDGCGGLIIKL